MFSGEQREDLVGRRVESQLIALIPQGLADALGLVNGVFAAGEIQSVGKERVELNPRDPPFGEQRSVLLDDREEMRHRVLLWEHHRLPEKCAAFGAADVKGIAQAGKVGKMRVIFRAGQGACKPRPVKVEGDARRTAHAVQCFQFRE